MIWKFEVTFDILSKSFFPHSIRVAPAALQTLASSSKGFATSSSLSHSAGLIHLLRLVQAFGTLASTIKRMKGRFTYGRGAPLVYRSTLQRDTQNTGYDADGHRAPRQLLSVLSNLCRLAILRCYLRVFSRHFAEGIETHARIVAS